MVPVELAAICHLPLLFTEGGDFPLRPRIDYKSCVLIDLASHILQNECSYPILSFVTFHRLHPERKSPTRAYTFGIGRGIDFPRRAQLD